MLFAVGCSDAANESSSDSADKQQPSVAATVPGNGEENTSVSEIVVIFSEEIDPLTLRTDTIQIIAITQNQEIQIAFTADDLSYITKEKTLKVNVNGNLIEGATHEVRLAGNKNGLGIKDLSGNTLATDSNDFYSWSFVTSSDTVPPEIVPESIKPEKNTLDYGVTSEISIAFTEQINKDSLNAAFSLYQVVGSDLVSVPGTIVYSENSMIATFVPNSALAQGGLFRATINTTLEDLNGNNLVKSQEWEFETTSTPEVLPVFALEKPNASAAAFPIQFILNIQFSEAIDPLSLSTVGSPPSIRLYAVSNPSNFIGVTLSQIDSSVFQFSPNLDLDISTDYRITIEGVENLAGNPMASAYNFDFTTRGRSDKC